MKNLNKSIELALRTWYPKDHPLHFNPHHPLGKLLGEWGELLDDYMKSLYKPGYAFNPIDELGDIWYYLRILLYQCDNQEYNSSITKYLSKPSNSNYGIDYIIALAMQDVSGEFAKLIHGGKFKEYSLTSSTLAISILCNRNNLTLDNLTHSNWQKLKPGSERGEEWMKARVSTDYTGGKIGLK